MGRFLADNGAKHGCMTLGNPLRAVLVACLGRAAVPLAAARGRSEQGAAHRRGRRPRPASIPARVSDLYSNVVTEAIFERLLTYDYLARPAKLVPQAAEAMPDVADNGRTYTFRIRKGIYFTPDPGVQGQAARADRGRLRLLVQALRRPGAALAVGVPDRGQDRRARRRSPRRRSGTASSTTRRASPGCRRSIATRCASSSSRPTTCSCTRWRTRRSAQSRARSSRRMANDLMAHPVGTGPVRAEGMAAREQDRPRGEPRLSRLHLGLRVVRAGLGRRGRRMRCAARRCRRSVASRST